ncbi:MAG: BNR repeat-containing protein, partial [Flavitalea sp.]
MKYRIFLICFLLMVFIAPVILAQEIPGVHLSRVDSGWAANSVNAVVFRKNSIASFRDTQLISYYDKNGIVVVGKRKIGTDNWELKNTGLKGNVWDAHNSISIAVDGEGYIHLAWDHHNSPLKYLISKSPGSLDFTDLFQMIGKHENKLSYPEFYSLPDGNLVFLYRDGGSGGGNLVLNKYHTKEKKWSRLHDNLVDGEGKRNAYWQATTDNQGVIHLSWVWRESPDVASNHDLCYARSKDGGISWEKSNGDKYNLPITASTAEYAAMIPQKSELINQTSMTTDDKGNPFIATYWRDQGSSIPSYRIVYLDKGKWRISNLDFRKTPFSLSGMGSKRIPISRPQVLVKGKGRKAAVWLIFRDEERNGKVSVATTGLIK